MGRGGGGGGGLTAAGLASAVLAAEVCAPILLLCGLCCWPDDSSDKSSNSGKRPQKPVVAQGRRRSSDVFSRRAASSGLSLHLPSTSGTGTPKQPLSAHRSHEEIPRRRASRPHPHDDDSRYHSAPSVIDEVLHRRDWERSTKELYIPLRPPGSELEDADSDASHDANSDATNPYPDSTPVPGSAEGLSVPCKKHYTNIKSSRNRTKESRQDDVKDKDATEDISNSCSNFYIGDIRDDAWILSRDNTNLGVCEASGWEGAAANDVDRVTSGYTVKEAKQTFNESIKSKRPADEDLEGALYQGLASGRFEVSTVDLDLDQLVSSPEWDPSAARDPLVSCPEWDRSGAMHHTAIGSYTSLATTDSRTTPYITPSQEHRPWMYELASAPPRPRLLDEGSGRGGGRGGRHASDGDILAPAHRPESGAFSESDVEPTASAPLPRPDDVTTSHPKYRPAAERKETAI